MSKINIFVISGGLGNQLFQIAAAANYSLKYKTRVYLDTVTYYSNSHLNFECKHLVKRLKKNNVYIYCNIPILLRCLVIANKIFNLQYLIFFSYPFLKTTNEIKPYKYQELKNSNSLITIFRGYWQSEKYFIENRNFLKKIFTNFFKKFDLNSKKNTTKSSMKKIVVHFRFGDYLYTKGYAALNINYYKKAINYFKKKLGNYKIIAFSDDLKKLKKETKNINIDHYFDDKKMNVKKVFSTMLSGDHYIIANSTFSWWAAYLSENKNKIIISPERWFPIKIFMPDLIPVEWLKISNTHM